MANRFVASAVCLERAFEEASTHGRAFAVISLYADWEEFSRRLVYASAASRPSAADGRRIPRAPGIRSHGDVDSSLKAWKRRRPNQPLVLHLGYPRTMVEACKQLQLANERVISPAILSQGSPANDLRLARNFLAHQNPSTAGQVIGGPPPGSFQIDTFVGWLSQRQAGGRTRLGVWAGDLSAVARACTN